MNSAGGGSPAFVEDEAALEALYGAAPAAATRKVTRRLTPAYRAWIEASRFAVLSTVGPEGTDASPRGDDGPVVRVVDDARCGCPIGAATIASTRCATWCGTGGCR